MNNSFAPLAFGEAPGDPELGGWRPLPKGLFYKPASFHTSSTAMSLEQAVTLVGFTVQYLNLEKAAEALANELRRSPFSLWKGGVQFS